MPINGANMRVCTLEDCSTVIVLNTIMPLAPYCWDNSAIAATSGTIDHSRQSPHRHDNDRKPRRNHLDGKAASVIADLVMPRGGRWQTALPAHRSHPETPGSVAP